MTRQAPHHDIEERSDESAEHRCEHDESRAVHARIIYQRQLDVWSRKTPILTVLRRTRDAEDC